MSKKEKLIARLKSKPKDFTFNEAKTLLSLCGYSLSNAGKTSGSGENFIKGKNSVRLHKPHPKNELKGYQIQTIIDELNREELL